MDDTCLPIKTVCNYFINVVIAVIHHYYVNFTLPLNCLLWTRSNKFWVLVYTNNEIFYGLQFVKLIDSHFSGWADGYVGVGGRTLWHHTVRAGNPKSAAITQCVPWPGDPCARQAPLRWLWLGRQGKQARQSKWASCRWHQSRMWRWDGWVLLLLLQP